MIQVKTVALFSNNSAKFYIQYLLVDASVLNQEYNFLIFYTYIDCLYFSVAKLSKLCLVHLLRVLRCVRNSIADNEREQLLLRIILGTFFCLFKVVEMI